MSKIAPASERMYGLILAAGQSARMGQPKQLLIWHGEPLVRHVVHQALAAPIVGVFVVIGAVAGPVRQALDGLAVTLVENPDYAAGQAVSLACGLRALPADATAALILLVDQPLITTALLTQITNTYCSVRQTDNPPIAVVPRYNGRRGNPVVLSRQLFPELIAYRGDAGPRYIVERYSERIYWFDVGDPAVVMDADTPEEFRRMQAGA